MTCSVGIDHGSDLWRICLSEDERLLDYTCSGDAQAVLRYMHQVCETYPRPIIALSSFLETSLSPLKTITNVALYSQDLEEFLEGVDKVCSKGYWLPSIQYVASVPRHRKLYRSNMGTSAGLCAVATLLYRMRARSAMWTEMRFLYLSVSAIAYTILVIEDGCIVDGIDVTLPLREEDAELDDALVEQAFWESLTENLAGLLAVHHLDDIVIVRRQSAESRGTDCREAVIDRLGDTYKFYQFPYEASEAPGHEAAIGAALIAAGFCCSGLAAEVVQRLLAPTPLL